MLVRERNRIPNPCRLLQIPVFVGLQQNNVAIDHGIGRIHVAENLCPCRIRQSFIAVDVQFGPLLFSLIPVENSQGNTHADAKVLVDGRIAPEIECERGIG